MVKKKIIWDIVAQAYLKKSIAYIKRDCIQNGEMVKKAILDSIKKLSKANSILTHAPDSYKEKIMAATGTF